MSANVGTMNGVGEADLTGHPKGLYVLFGAEMWERFSFYSMLALFTLYLQNAEEGFGWVRNDATRLYSYYLAAVYFTPLIGGFIADRALGYRKSVIIGGFFFMAGHLLLSFRSVTIMYLALVCLVIGNGFFKPNVSAMVGKLYPEGSHLKDRAFNIFYMGINIGAFLAPLVMEAVRSSFGYHAAFAVAAAGMLVSVGILILFKRHIEGVDVGTGADTKRAAAAAAAAGGTRADDTSAVTGNEPQASLTTEDLPPIEKSVDAAKTDEPRRNLIDSVSDSKRILALIVIFLIVIVFWMAFHQNGSTWTYWANDNTDWTASAVVPILVKILTLGRVSGEDISGVISNAINPFWVIVLTFPLIGFWAWLDKRGLEPSTPAKMGIGMFLVAAAYLIMYWGAISGGDTGRVSPWWLIIAYAVITLGELMLSPMGLSLVSKVAPIRLRGLMMGGWFAATSIGNYLVGTIGVQWTVWTHSKFFLVIAAMCAAIGVILFLIIKPLKKAMPGV
ncbi:MAG TPA: peptide MFS transporter [Pyrinomonadaceae bacterium]|nr:peptide MFS transporter [Pyrinomonadaceae bacterium]